MQSVKVVVTGPFNAGKTTFIKSVSEITVLSTERQVSDVSGDSSGETTVAMDFGRITVSDDVVLYLFGTPGQSRFSFMWETLSEGMLGFFLLVDTYEPPSFPDAKEMIEFFTGMSDVPFVIAANKVDAEDTEAVSQREDLGLDSRPAPSVDACTAESRRFCSGCSTRSSRAWDRADDRLTDHCRGWGIRPVRRRADRLHCRARQKPPASPLSSDECSTSRGGAIGPRRQTGHEP
jgi:signal recognition particle receptor subunit beta